MIFLHNMVVRTKDSRNLAAQPILVMANPKVVVLIKDFQNLLAQYLPPSYSRQKFGRQSDLLDQWIQGLGNARQLIQAMIARAEGIRIKVCQDTDIRIKVYRRHPCGPTKVCQRNQGIPLTGRLEVRQGIQADNQCLLGNRQQQGNRCRRQLNLRNKPSEGIA